MAENIKNDGKKYIFDLKHKKTTTNGRRKRKIMMTKTSAAPVSKFGAFAILRKSVCRRKPLP